MNCIECGQSNPDDAKFCNECGSGLARSCVDCGHTLPATAKFCGECGTAVAAHSRRTAPSTAPSETATRKQVTALFADLVGSTAFGESVDGEVARSALADYFDLLSSTIETHAGFVAKFTGDGVMAVFGLPEVAEDDALRAVAAGRELQRRFAGFTERVRARHGAELGLRVGVNTGELVVGDDDADLVGDVLNTAARLEAACESGGVLVGEETWRLTRSSVAYDMAGDIRAKGKAEPVATFAVVDVAAVEGDEASFVGRADELAALVEMVDLVQASDSAQLVTVIGAPGVGKTRLAAEVRDASGVRSFDLRIERRGATTFSPVADLVREATGGLGAEAITALIGDQQDAERLATALGALVGSGVASSTEEAFWAVRRLIEVLAAEEPLLLVIDDIQWAEPLFWDLLEHVAEWATAPVMLLALARPELRELRLDLTHPGRVVATSISLDGLDADTTVELARSLLDGDDLPFDLVDRLPTSTDGNPLFVRELVRMLVDDGVLERSDAGWELTVDVEAIDVPPTVLSLLASRVERLPADERDVLELASVIGTEFDRGSLVALATAERAGRIGALLERLRRRDLIQPSGAWVGDEPLFRFHHVLLRDAAYRRLLKARRAELHELLADHVVESGSTGTDETDVAAALHFESAFRFRSELGEAGPDVEALAESAIERLAASAARALDRDDLAAAGGYAVRALELDSDGVRRDELLLVGCEALLSSGDAVRAEALVDELAERRSDDRASAWADCFRTQRWTLTDSSRLDEAASLSQEAAQRLEALGDDGGVAKARLVRAAALARLGRIAECEDELDLALGAARRAEDRRRVAAVLGVTPLAALWGPSPAARAGGRCLDVLRLLHITTASPGVEATSYRCQGVLEALRGRFESARSKLETSREIVRELGLRQGVSETELFAGIVELLADDSAAAAGHLGIAVTGLDELGMSAEAGRASALLAIALLDHDDVEKAEALASAAQQSAGQNLQTAIASAVALGRVRSAQGRFDEAEELVATAIALAEPTDVVLDRAMALGAGARIAEAAGDSTLAAERHSTARRLVEDKGSQHWIGVSLVDEDEPAAGSDEGARSVAESASSSAEDDRPRARPASDDGSLFRRYSEAVMSLDAQRIRELLADSFLFVDRRRVIGWGELDADGWIELQLRGIEPASVGVPDVISTDGGVTLARMRHAAGPAVAEDQLQWDQLVLTQVVDGLIERVETFDLDDRTVASERFDALRSDGRAQPADVLALDQRHEGEALLRSTPPSSPIEPNEAWRVVQAIVDGWCEGDVEAVRALMADGYTSRRVDDLDVGPVDAEDHISLISEYLGDSDIAEYEVALLATRGDRLCAFSLEAPSEVGEIRRTAVMEARNGKAVSTRWFVDGDLTELRTALDERAVELGMVGDVWVGRSNELNDAIDRHDADAIRACASEDFVLVDRRSLGIGELDRERWVDVLVTRPDGNRTDTVEIIRSGARVSLVMTKYSDPDEHEWWMLHLSEIDENEQFVRLEIFDADQRGEAIVRFEELRSHAGPRRTLANDAAIQLERALLTGLPGELGAAPHVEGWFDSPLSQADADSVDVEVLAIRDDQLCLARCEFSSEAGGLTSHLIVGETGDGQIVRVDVFDGSQLDDAADRLDRRWAELSGLNHAHVTVTMRELGYGPQCRQLLTDDFEMIDHKPLGLGRLGPDEWIATVSSVEDVTAFYHREFLHADGRVSLAEIRAVTADGSEWASYQLATMRDELVHRWEVFALDQLDEALALLDELALASNNPSADDSVELENAATRHLRFGAAEELRGLARGERGHLNEDDFVWRERRRSAPHVELHGEESGASFDVFLANGLVGIDHRTLAIRDDHLALSHADLLFDSGDVVPCLALIELGPTGRSKSTTIFDPDQLDDALEALTLAWVARGEVAEEWARLSTEERRRLRDGEVDQPVTRPSAPWIDHRRLGFGELTAADFAAMRATVPGYRSYPSEIPATEGDVMLCRMVAEADDRAAWESLTILVKLGHEVVRTEVFDADDVVSARARFDELVTEASDAEVVRVHRRVAEANQRADVAARDDLVPTVENRCSTLLRASVEVLPFGMTEEMLAEFTQPDFVWRERRRTSPHVDLVGNDVLLTWEAWSSMDVTGMVATTLGVRGDDLALVRVDADGSVWSLLAVQALGESGLASSITVFDADQLDEAFRLLDDLWVERGGCAWWATSSERRAVDDGDRALPDDGLLVDHRPLGFGQITGRQYSEMQQTDLAARIDTAKVLAFDDRRLLSLARGVHESAEWWAYLVVDFAGHPERRIDIYPVDQLPAAQERYDELADSHEDDAEVLVVLRRIIDATLEGDGRTLAALVDSEFRWHERQRFAPQSEYGRGEELDDNLSFWSGRTRSVEVQQIASRSADLAAFRNTMELDDLTEPLRFLGVARLGANGKLVDLAYFDGGQLDEALEFLDRLWTEAGGGDES